MLGWVIETECWKGEELQAVGRTEKETEEAAVQHAAESIKRYLQNGFKKVDAGTVRKTQADGSVLEFRIRVLSASRFRNYPFG